MKCKRLCAAILSLVMIISLLPTTALAANESTNYEPSVEFLDGIWKHTLTVKVYYEGGKDPVIEKSYSGRGTAKVVAPSGMEVYSTEGSTGGFYTDLSELFSFTKNNGTLNLYLRSKAGHTVTVNYVYADDSSKNKPVSKNVKYAEEKSFGKLEKDYGYEITVSSGDAKYEVDSLDVLRVTGGVKDSEITVTYTPKNVIYIDQYYDNGSSLVKWNNTHITLNGPELLNGAAEAAVIENKVLTDDMEDYRFLKVKDVTYDFSFACLFPRQSDKGEITDLWYKDEANPLGYHWFYSHFGKTVGIPWGKSELSKGSVNFCYNTQHTEKSEYHDFVATTVDHTCTEKGYTDYKCKYCDKTKRDGFTDPLGHDWEWKHDDTTSGADSKHYQVCNRCNINDNIENCRFDIATTETGTHTCTVCRHSYTDETTPTGTPVYVYFKTVNTKNEPVNVERGVTYNKDTGHWATLGKLETTIVVTADNKDFLGAKVIAKDGFAYHSDNDQFKLSLITSWDELKEEAHGACGYAEEAPLNKKVWHLNGTVTAYRVTYNANLPDGVTESVTVPDPAYYLLGGKATVSTDAPKLQDYVFGGWYTERECKNKVGETVTVTGDTVLYAKWTPLAQPTADLIDNNIIIKHSVNGDPAHGDDSTTVHIVNKDAQISYQATLDMQSLKFGDNPENKTAVSVIQKMIGNASLWEFMMGSNITMFADSTVNLHVKFSDKLVNPAALNNITLESGWFKRDPAKLPAYDEATGYWTIPCVIKNAKDEPNTNDSIITLSGITLSLTDKAQGELSSGKDLEVVSKGYIDGTIKISAFIASYTLKLEGKSKEAPAQNTAKLKLDVPTYTVTYTDGANGSAFKDQVYSGLKSGVATPAFNGTPERDGYTFNSWEPAVDKTVTKDATYTATWTRNSSRDDDDDKYFFAIQKVDAQDGHALNDAKFELYQRDNRGNKLAAFRKTTSHWGPESGIALFSVSATKTNEGGDTWYYREITAPEGYVLDTKEYEISASDFYHNDQSKAVAKAETVRNYRGSTPDLLNGDDHFAYVVGYQDGCVHPNALITRAETATIFFRLLKDSVRDGNLLTSNTFADVPNDYWANTAISTMAGLGIVQGYNSTAFAPNASITRAEFAAICARFDTGKSSGTQTFTDIKGHWAEKYIERAAELGWIKGLEDGTFRPNDCITRAQAMTMINRVLNRIPEENGDLLSSMNVWPDCNPGDWFYLAVQEATNSHDYKHKAGNYETWTGMSKDPDWTRYEN